MNYKIIANEDRLREFIAWLPDLKPDEIFLVSLFARKKYYLDSTGIKSDKNQLKRFTSTKEWLFQKIQQLEVAEGAYQSDGKPIPQEALALYITVNPRNQIKAAKALIKELVDVITIDYNGFNVHKLALNATQKATGRKVFMDYDFDSADLNETWEALEGKINKSALTVVKTRGGFHLLVEVGAIEREYVKSWYQAISSMPGVDVVSNSDLLPVPGCVQGGFTPHFIEHQDLPRWEMDQHMWDAENPYCMECGSEEREFLNSYTDSDLWRCKDCKREYQWTQPERND